jgi:rhomboid protease GluP
MIEVHPAPMPDMCYRPRLARTWGIGIAFALCAAALTGVWLATDWTAGTIPGLHTPVVLLIAGAILVPGALALVAAARGRPRLTVNATGIRLDTFWRTQWAAWPSLGAFHVTTASDRLTRRTVLAARARIIGSDVSRGLRGKSQFLLPDRFQTLIADVVAEINARHPSIHQHEVIWHDGGAVYAEDNRRGIKSFTTPWLTITLLGALIAAFVLEQKYAIGPHGPLMRPSLATLQAMGALSGEAVRNHGEWYRLFTATMLHANLTHLIGNCVALFMAGYVLENLVGRAWLFALFVLGGMGGSVLSLAMLPPTLPGVGASGAIVALFAAGLIVSFRMAPGPARWMVQARFVATVLTSVVPLAATAGPDKVNYAAHIGGALVGAVIGLLLLCSWPRANRLPQFTVVAQGIAAMGVLLLFSASVATAARYPTYVAQSPWIPSNRVPLNLAQMELNGADLAARYPQDPRAHMFYGVALVGARDNVGAEREFETSLQLSEHGGTSMGPRFETTLWAMLAVALAGQGQRARAKDVAQTACQARGTSRSSPEITRLLQSARLCG